LKKLLKTSLTLIFTLIIVLGFAMPLNLPNGTWQQQFMPNLNGRTIQDIQFIDSLTGYVSARQSGDTSYILKTINAGDNWQIIYRSFLAMEQIQFLNVNTGYACGAYLFKTTNAGLNWNQVTAPAISPEELFVLNEDTIWIVSSNSFNGGAYRTTNGGSTWEQQFSGGSQNPSRIYMYNARIGFLCNSSAASPNIYKTTNSGINWSVNLPGEYFYDIHFTDSLTGWKCVPGVIAGDSSVKKTTNGGVNWFKQTLPSGGIIIAPAIGKFAFVNADTIYGVGSAAFYGGGQFRGIIFRTINGGNNWLFQVPDTTIHIASYSYAQFVTGKIGWAYSQTTGIHTTNGGDTTWLTPVTQISTEIPKQYKLFQNYPNPFNPRTNIKYNVKSRQDGTSSETSKVKITVFDIQGKQVDELVNQKQSAGTYEVDYSGNNMASGIYFYSLIIDGLVIDTKKMILIK